MKKNFIIAILFIIVCTMVIDDVNDLSTESLPVTTYIFNASTEELPGDTAVMQIDCIYNDTAWISVNPLSE
jgi:hypothetical protein